MTSDKSSVARSSPHASDPSHHLLTIDHKTRVVPPLTPKNRVVPRPLYCYNPLAQHCCHARHTCDHLAGQARASTIPYDMAHIPVSTLERCKNVVGIAKEFAGVVAMSSQYCGANRSFAEDVAVVKSFRRTSERKARTRGQTRTQRERIRRKVRLQAQSSRSC